MTSEDSTPRMKGIPGFAVLLLIAGAFIVGMFWNRMQSLEKQVTELSKGGSANQNAGQPAGTGVNAGAQPNAAAGQPQLGSAGQVDPISDEDHVRGNAKADLMLIEYSDFQCPYCKTFHPTMQQVVEEYGDKVAWAYRHFPLSSIHPNAQKAAEASECVAELGGDDAFWKFADALFGGTQSLTDAELNQAATSAGVNQSSFTTCLGSGKHTQTVNDDFASGQAAGVSGTPGTIILTKDGESQLIPGALPYAQVKQAIDSLL